MTRTVRLLTPAGVLLVAGLLCVACGLNPRPEDPGVGDDTFGPVGGGDLGLDPSSGEHGGGAYDAGAPPVQTPGPPEDGMVGTGSPSPADAGDSDAALPDAGSDAGSADAG